jgi:hypothetical protein
MKPTTIDNLSIDHSRAYAANQKELETNPYLNPQLQPGLTSIAVSSPIQSTEYSNLTLFSATLANFPELKDQADLFGVFFAAKLGKRDLSALLDKVEEMLQNLNTTAPNIKFLSILKKLLVNLIEIDSIHKLLTARRDQYQKG